MLDNVVELNNLPLGEQRKEILAKRRHGMGFLGLGSALSLLNLRYGSTESVEFAEKVSRELAVNNYTEGVSLAKEKGCAPILKDLPNRNSWMTTPYMEKVFSEVPEVVRTNAGKYGCRFTHATSIAPTGTISLSVNNNTSNGVEPSFSHSYTRNVIKANKNTKEAVRVLSYEALVAESLGLSTEGFSTSDDVSPKEHVDIQAAVQKWIDSSVSKTVNVPTDIDFEEFKDLYMYGYDKNLKGMTTFRFNPEAFQGVLVKDEDLNGTQYKFTTEQGEEHTVTGDTIIEYEKEEHTAANLYDALKEGYYGKF